MKWKSVILNNHSWEIKGLGENALLLELQNAPKDSIDLIINTVQLIQNNFPVPLTDLVPAYQSIALIFDSTIYSFGKVENIILKLSGTAFHQKKDFPTHEIPVCYEKGLDWEFVCQHCQLTKAQIIEKHTANQYRVAMTGFLPGFVYLAGMDEKLNCPRKENPRTQVPKGALGIGGNQTGIYSLPSPGGWQIIGQSPLSFFNNSEPPHLLKAGDYLRFVAIDVSTFEQLQTTQKIPL